ncbi:hypothetical protein PCAR4_290007 [Paraburkholderia caribensis]|nr:hypothetical protein PCAR4_290007 [Paraburkholderia caribensis]
MIGAEPSHARYATRRSGSAISRKRVAMLALIQNLGAKRGNLAYFMSSWPCSQIQANAKASATVQSLLLT